jgi:hypothetical protein
VVGGVGGCRVNDIKDDDRDSGVGDKSCHVVDDIADNKMFYIYLYRFWCKADKSLIINNIAVAKMLGISVKMTLQLCQSYGES